MKIGTIFDHGPLDSIDEDLQNGLSTEEVYIKTNKNKNADSPIEIVNLITVQNRKYNLKKSDPGLTDTTYLHLGLIDKIQDQ